MKVCLRDSVYSSWKDRNDHTVFGKIALTMNLLDICCIEERLPLIVGSSCYEKILSFLVQYCAIEMVTLSLTQCHDIVAKAFPEGLSPQKTPQCRSQKCHQTFPCSLGPLHILRWMDCFQPEIPTGLHLLPDYKSGKPIL